MAIRTGAIAVLVESSQTYSVRRNWSTGGREGKVTLWRTYEIPWVDEAPETRQVAIPTDFVYHGGRNVTVKKINGLAGLRYETFRKPPAPADPWEELD